MNKKILAVAVATAMAVPLAALADEGNVTIYGQANVSVDFIDNDSSETDNVSTNQSVFGIQGSEPLGNGISAVFHWDVFAGVDDGSEDIGGPGFFGGSRDSWVGFAGGFGTVALGAQGRPWKTATNNVDFFVNTIADYAGIIGTVPTGGIAHDTGIGNSIIWFGPNINGFSWHAQVGADEADDGSREWGVQGNYTNGPLYATLAYDLQEEASVDGEDVEAFKASLSYTFFDALTVSGIYDNVGDDGAGTAERDAYYLGAAYKFGNNAIKGAYALAEETDFADDVGADDGAEYFAIGLFHTFSKRTEVYALYAQTDNEDEGAYGLGFPNATSASSSGNSSPLALGDDVNAFSIGLHHNF
jgi:predicted porin